MKRNTEIEEKTFLLYIGIVITGLIAILVLTKVNIEVSGMYPDVSSIILIAFGIGAIVGVLVSSVGGLAGFLILKFIESKKEVPMVSQKIEKI